MMSTQIKSKPSRQCKRMCPTASLLLAISLVVSTSRVVQSVRPSGWLSPTRIRGSFGLQRQSSSASLTSASCLLVPRGGSDAVDKETEDNEGQVDDNEEKDEGEEEDSKSKITSTEPVNLHIKTNLNNAVVDIHALEIMALRMRDIGSIKKALSRQLPGKPPIESIRLMQHGHVLREELLIDELMDDDDEDEEDDDEDGDDDNKASLTLVLDMVPPVDPRSFSGTLQEKMESQSTADLLEAYALNEAAIWYASRELSSAAAAAKEGADGDEEASTVEPSVSDDESSPLITFELRKYANTFQSQILATALSEKAAALLDDPVPPAQAAAEEARKPQVRGQRTRIPASLTAGGLQPSSSVVGLKQTAQHFLNINWGDTIRNFCLFLFFGWFGGRTVMSRAVLLLGAPMCFIVQARPVKLMWKELLYLLLRNPPGIVLSLLPAPQQAMLALSDDEAMRLIYGDDAPVAVVDDEESYADIPEWDDEEDEEEDVEDSYDDEDEDSEEDF